MVINPESEKKIVEEILSQYQQLKIIRSPYELVWKEIAEFMLPKRHVFDLDDSRRGSRVQKLYDGTAISALNLMVNGFLGYLISRVTKWQKLYHEDNSKMRFPVVRRYFQDVEDALYSEFNRSNFYESITEVFKDGGSIGTSGIHIEEDIKNRRINYSSRHPKEIYISENRFGYVDTIFRCFYMTAKQIIESFKDDNLGEKWIKENKTNLYKKHEILHAVFPRENRDVTKIDSKNKYFASYYILKGESRLLRESGFDTLPDIIWRWEKNSDEEYGRSPAWNALTDTKGLNKISKDLLQSGDYAVNPFVQYPSSSDYRLNLHPGGSFEYESPDEIIKILEMSKGFPIGRDREEAKQKAIRDHFHVDFFLGLAQVTKQMNIPEVMERQGEKAAVLGTTVGRINSELLDPIIEKTYQIANEAGRMPEIPDILLDDDGEIKIEYIGPLAQIQKRHFATQGINQVLGQLRPVAELDGSVLDLLDIDELGKEILIQGGMPQKVLRDENKIMQIRRGRAQAQAKNEQMQQIESMSKAAPNLNQKIQDGTMLSDLNAELSEAVNG